MQFPEIIWYVIIPTAAITSIVTAALVYFLARKLYYDEIEKPIDDLPDRISLKVEEAGDRLLPRFEERVKKGFLAALKDSPKLGPEMTAGMIESALKGMDQIITGRKKRE
ncbi:MAG TPA: hypothetical protein PLY93_01440 [Turneriella sp.]|nr:hypothetical protein [Turneriella sp.]